MSYYYSKKLNTRFDNAVEAVSSALEKEGFGVLTDIDVQQVMKEKLDADFRPYRILGACNPQLAYKALELEKRIGTMLPCNVIIQEDAEESTIDVAAVDPGASMEAVQNEKLGSLAAEVQEKLRRVIDSL